MKSAESFVIQGLAGKKTLSGSVRISGAKNAALKAMAAAILFDGPVTLQNMPNNADIVTLSEILTKIGATITQQDTGTITIDSTSITSTDLDMDLAAAMRASVVLTGPLLARYGKVSIPTPGGCVIGARPIDLFIAGYKKMGATVEVENDCLYKISGKSLTATSIFFDKVSVGGTETLLMAAVLGTGTTILENCAMEPEIVNVAEWLNACGAKISGAGTTTISIEGTGGTLLKPSKPFVTIPDRIEAGSFLFLGALCADTLTIEQCRPDHLQSVISILVSAGVPLTIGKDSITISKNGSRTNASFTAPTSVQTHEYPGFATDVQAQLVTFLTQISGSTTVLETIFEGRFKYTADLVRMGAAISSQNAREISITGPTQLKAVSGGQELKAHDIRAGFAMVMAALVATGTTTLTNVQLIDRGYEKLEQRLQALGADIKRALN